MAKAGTEKNGPFNKRNRISKAVVRNERVATRFDFAGVRLEYGCEKSRLRKGYDCCH